MHEVVRSSARMEVSELFVMEARGVVEPWKRHDVGRVGGLLHKPAPGLPHQTCLAAAGEPALQGSFSQMQGCRGIPEVLEVLTSRLKAHDCVHQQEMSQEQCHPQNTNVLRCLPSPERDGTRHNASPTILIGQWRPL